MEIFIELWGSDIITRHRLRLLVELGYFRLGLGDLSTKLLLFIRIIDVLMLIEAVMSMSKGYI